MKFGQIKRPLLLFCLGVSLLLHVAVIWVLYLNPVSFERGDTVAVMRPASSPQTIPQEDANLLAKKMERALEESLNMAIALTQTTQNSDDIAQDAELKTDPTQQAEASETAAPKTLFATAPHFSQEEVALCTAQEEASFSTSLPPPFDPELEIQLSDFACDDEIEEPPRSYESETMASIDLSEHRYQTHAPPTAEIIHDDYTMTDEQFSPQSLPTHRKGELTPDFIHSLKRLKTPKERLSSQEMSAEKMFSVLEESTAPKLILPNSIDYLRDQWIKQSLAERALPDMDFYGLGDIVTNIEWEDDLEIDVAIMPTQHPNQYVFSLTIHPEFASTTPGMKQNFYFAIDRSSSIEKHKFSRFKRAVQRAFAALHEGDTFNIYIFDKQVVKFSDQPLPATPTTLQMAEEFLEGQSSKTHFAATEIYTSLEEVLPDRFDPEELHSVILITDGNTLLGSTQQKQALFRCAERYGGLVNFYAAACGKGNNLVLLDVLSYTTAGHLLYSDTNAGFPRKLVRLIKDLHNPIMKDVSIDIQAKDPQAHIALYPKKGHVPPIFADKAYIIVGTIDELCDLTLHMQGRNHGKWLNIHKNISFKDRPLHSRSLEKRWATTQSHICYDHFLKNGKTTHLKEAIQIVSPYRGVIAAEQ